jgi:ABC-type nitrate/sulfonate/bicarbonate transport system permease component
VLTARARTSEDGGGRQLDLVPPAASGGATFPASGDAPAVPQSFREAVGNLAFRAGRGRGISALQWVVSVAVLVGLWQLLVTTLHPNPLAIVGPWQVLHQGITLAKAGTLGTDLGTSGEEFGIGFAIAIVLGVGLGVVLGVNRRLASFFDPWVMVFYTVPVIAIAPMIILGLGITVTSKVVIVAAAAVFPILINTQAGVRSVDRGLHDVSVAFRANRIERLRFVLLPGSVPYILTGVRLGVGRGLISVVAGDLFGATSGIGYLILAGQQNLNTASVYVGVVCLSIAGLVLTQLTSMLERRFQVYRNDSGGHR